MEACLRIENNFLPLLSYLASGLSTSVVESNSSSALERKIERAKRWSPKSFFNASFLLLRRRPPNLLSVYQPNTRSAQTKMEANWQRRLLGWLCWAFQRQQHQPNNQTTKQANNAKQRIEKRKHCRMMIDDEKHASFSVRNRRCTMFGCSHESGSVQFNNNIDSIALNFIDSVYFKSTSSRSLSIWLTIYIHAFLFIFLSTSASDLSNSSLRWAITATAATTTWRRSLSSLPVSS